MSILRRIGRREDGVAMLTVVILVAFLSMVSVALIDLVTSESTRSNSARTSNAAFQAAEAGLDDYLSKLVDDKTYYLHHVHPAESTRRPTAGADVDPLPNGTTCNATKTGALGIDWTGTADLGSEHRQRQGQLVPARQRLRVQPADHAAQRHEREHPDPLHRPEDLQPRVLDLELVRPWHEHHPVARRAGMGALVAAVRLPDDHELRLQRRRRLRRRTARSTPGETRAATTTTSITRAPPRPISTPKGRSPDPRACRTGPRSTPARRFARSSRRRSTSATSPHPSTTSRRRRSRAASTSTPASPSGSSCCSRTATSPLRAAREPGVTTRAARSRPVPGRSRPIQCPRTAPSTSRPRRSCRGRRRPRSSTGESRSPRTTT